jgi:hypothetical protein
MKKLLPLGLFVFWFGTAKSGNDHVPVGARAAALSHASVAISDVWAINNNVAGIARQEKTEIGAYAENRFGMKAFSSVSLVGATKIGKSGAAGAQLYRFGDKLYNEQRIGLGYAHRVGMVSLGVKADLMQVHVEEFGTKRVVAFSFGGQSELVPGFTVGAHIFNLNQAKLADFQDERVPTVMAAGISYKPGAKIMLNVETEKDLEQDADFKAGLEYQVIEKLALRTGFSTLNQTASFGVGFKAKAFQLDYALSSQSRLGFSNHISVGYKFE